MQAFAEREKSKNKVSKTNEKTDQSEKEKKKACMPKGNKTKSLKYKPKATEKSKHDSSEEEVDFDQERTIDSRCQACHSTKLNSFGFNVIHVIVRCVLIVQLQIDFENTFQCPRCSK